MKIILADEGNTITIIAEWPREEECVSKILLNLTKEFPKAICYTDEMYDRLFPKKRT